MFFDSWHGLLRVLVVGTLAYVALVFFLRVSGKRTLSKMNAFDLVVTVALGSTLATITLSKSVALLEGAVALALLIALQLVVTWLSVRSASVRHIVKSEPTLLFCRGHMLAHAMREQRVTPDEVRAAVRAQRIGRMEDVEAVILETDGGLTVLPRSPQPTTAACNVDGYPCPPEGRRPDEHSSNSTKEETMVRLTSMVRSLSTLVLPGALALSVCGGCKKDDEPAEYPSADPEAARPSEGEAASPAVQVPPGTPATTAAPTAGGASTGPAADPDLLVITVMTIDIDTKLAEVCGLPGSSVFFKYDSAKLSPEAKERLQQIATCATTGPAKGKDLVLVGRADPVGSDEYNKRLGTSRAESVARHLRGLGVPKARVEIDSRGEAAAMKEPYGWPLERRVTVRLQEP
jgi:uncharacterized membrane protein YcaP (DUF421 family)/outer membrane protein OmpA-like peptidoglycan-associated protein